MAIEGNFNLPPKKPERPEDPSTPFVHYSEAEIQEMIAGGMTEEEVFQRWHEENNRLAQAQLEKEQKGGGQAA
jgi:hypothetical protein